MKTPTRWRQAKPTAPDPASAARLVAAAEPPQVPTGAKERVRARLKASETNRAGLGFGWSLAIATGVVLISAVVFGTLSRGTEERVWRTDASEDRTIELAEWGRVALAPKTEIHRIDPAGHTLRLVRGRIDLASTVAGLRIVSGRFMVLPSPGSSLTLRASPFSAIVNGGRAEVRAPSGTRRVNAGQRYDASAPAAKAHSTEPSRPPQAPATTAKAKKTRPRRRPPPPPPPSAPAGGSPPTVDAPSIGSADDARPGGPRSARREDYGALYRWARSTDDADAAVAAFDRVLASGGPWAEMAGHQAVRRRIAQGRDADALRRLDALETRFPDGAHLPEVWLARIEVHVERGTLTQARRDLDRYLAAHGNSPRASDLYYLRGELHRQAGRFTAAKRDYARVDHGRFAQAARAALKKMKNR